MTDCATCPLLLDAVQALMESVAERHTALGGWRLDESGRWHGPLDDDERTDQC